MNSSDVFVGPADIYLSKVPRLGPRQRELLGRLVRGHGSLSRKWTPQRQARSLARRLLVNRSETGSVEITHLGRAVTRHLGLGE